MGMAVGNPYAEGTPEHTLWAHWHRTYFDQPVYSQLADVESTLRESLCELLRLNARVGEVELQRQIHSFLLRLEAGINLLDEIAEHELVRVVARDPVANGGDSTAT